MDPRDTPGYRLHRALSSLTSIDIDQLESADQERISTATTLLEQVDVLTQPNTTRAASKNSAASMSVQSSNTPAVSARRHSGRFPQSGAITTTKSRSSKRLRDQLRQLGRRFWRRLVARTTWLALGLVTLVTDLVIWL
jgi:hypothetical protein